MVKPNPTLRSSEGDASVLRDQPQGSPVFNVALQQAEPTKRQLSWFFRQCCQLVHCERLRQIARKYLRQIICKVKGFFQ
jgi:hypothetical protein